ncbi:MAG: alpha/beta fold hydrolase [Mycobacterium sp.]
MVAPFDAVVPVSVPVPDVPGGEAHEGGLPDRSELSVGQRAIVDASVVADLGLRTAVASLVGAAMLPPVIAGILRRSDLDAERENLAFYAELAAQHDSAKSFPAPTAPPKVSARSASPLANWMAHGHVEHIRFTSSFEPVNPAMRDRWSRLGRNNVVHAQHWRHDEDGPRPTLCVIHGFLGSAYMFNGLFFSLPFFFRAGYDIMLYTLPFHGRRAEKYSPFSGYGCFSNGMAGFAESMGQAVYDFRSVMDYLEYTGVERIALTGMSLGGYTSSLVASADDRLAAVIPNVPVVTPESAFDDWFPANKLVSLGRLAGGISKEESVAATAYHSPLTYTPKIAKDRRLIITGLGDRLAPPDQAEALWEHWDHCALHWFPGNHILHVSQPEYLRRMTRFMRPFMF